MDILLQMSFTSSFSTKHEYKQTMILPITRVYEFINQYPQNKKFDLNLIEHLNTKKDENYL